MCIQYVGGPSFRELSYASQPKFYVLLVYVNHLLRELGNTMTVSDLEDLFSRFKHMYISQTSRNIADIN